MAEIKAVYCDPKDARKPSTGGDPTEVTVMICCGDITLTDETIAVAFGTGDPFQGDSGVRVPYLPTNTVHHVFVDIEITDQAIEGGHRIRVTQGMNEGISGDLFTVNKSSA